ncbi:uncharacterized protein LOC143836816 [Paroedura picta]|uniref:uncharacterized protein LOC143836816 n=1 Tax=Paroedura picta TaxID=143630 RepID=UPI004056EC89
MVVLDSSTAGSPSASVDPSHAGAVGSGSLLSSPSGMVELDRVATEQAALNSKGYSAAVVDTILASRRNSTTRIYNCAWKAFVRWCRKRAVTPSRPKISNILQFLQDGRAAGLRSGTLRRQVAALSMVLGLQEGAPLSKHPHIVRFLKGAASLEPPPRHMFPTWRSGLVLSSLTKEPFEPIRGIPLKWLGMKTIFLVAVTSARRVSELGALSIDKELCRFRKSRVVLRVNPLFWPKVDSRFHISQEISLPTFFPSPASDQEREWHKLDVRRVLKIYVRRTASIRKSDSLFVFLSGSKVGEPLIKAAISRQVRACIVEAYRAAGALQRIRCAVLLRQRLSPGTPRWKRCAGQLRGLLLPHLSSITRFRNERRNRRPSGAEFCCT